VPWPPSHSLGLAAVVVAVGEFVVGGLKREEMVRHPCPRAQREAPPPCLDSLLRLLSWRSNSPLTREGCAGRQTHRAAGDGQGCAHSRSRSVACIIATSGWRHSPTSPGRPPATRAQHLQEHGKSPRESDTFLAKDRERGREGDCADCGWALRVTSARGSVFVLCRRAETDPAFPCYPRLPRLACPGYEREEVPPST
jgi:hypothetical protein